MTSLLDIYVLALLDRGIETPYALQRQGGLSLGASTPSLRRLAEARLVKRKAEVGMTNRPRHVYTLTASGRELARNGWREPFQSGRLPSDLESILRLSEIAAHYGAPPAEVARFLRTASDRRATLARRAAAEPQEGAYVSGNAITMRSSSPESRSRSSQPNGGGGGTVTSAGLTKKIPKHNRAPAEEVRRPGVATRYSTIVRAPCNSRIPG
jgi:DNA-binding PadR family transcriptional regulator